MLQPEVPPYGLEISNDGFSPIFCVEDMDAECVVSFSVFFSFEFIRSDIGNLGRGEEVKGISERFLENISM